MPGLYRESSDGDNYARVNIEALQTEHERANAQANALGIAPGYHFKLIRCARRHGTGSGTERGHPLASLGLHSCYIFLIRVKRASEITKNEQMREMVGTCVANGLKFR